MGAVPMQVFVPPPPRRPPAQPQAVRRAVAPSVARKPAEAAPPSSHPPGRVAAYYDGERVTQSTAGPRAEASLPLLPITNELPALKGRRLYYEGSTGEVMVGLTVGEYLALRGQARPPIPVAAEGPPQPVAEPEPKTKPVPLPKPKDYRDDLPAGAVRYTPARYSQNIATNQFGPRIHYVPVLALPDVRWHQSGGMRGLTGWRSEKYKTLPAPAAEMVAMLPVLNNFGRFQRERGLYRRYPVGTRFDDVLFNTTTGKVFEHRVREKLSTGWTSYVLDRDEAERPAGYGGLRVACNECHNTTTGPGTGGYALGLVPGSDTVFSDRLPWEQWNPAWAAFDAH